MPEIIIKLGDQIVQKYYLYKDQISIGRAPENEIAIENLAVSRRHAEISKENGSYVLEDLNSANGTFVNGVQVTRTEIVDKDVISIGKHKLYFYNQQVGAMQMVEKTMLVTRPAQTKAMLRVSRGKQKDQVFELSRVENRIGRAADNEIRLGDWFVSKHHAEIVRKGMVYVVRDLASWRHTMVNGQIVDEQVLKPGDEIQFGPKIAMVFEVADGTAAREGTGRKPVELEGADQPLPFAAAGHATPLPIAGSARVPGSTEEQFPGERHAAASADTPHQNGSARNPQLDEGWNEEFDPEDYVEDDEAGLAADELEEMEDDASDAEDFESEEQADEDAAFNLAPVRLEDEAVEAVGGWESAAAGAVGEDTGNFDAQAPRADASDSWSPEAIERARQGMADVDAAAGVSADEVDWTGGNGDANAGLSGLQGESSGEGGAGEEFVETSDSPGLESVALRDEEAQEQPEVAAAGATEAAGDRGEWRDGPSGIEFRSTSGSKGATLADSIMESFGQERGLVRSEIEMWVGALGNPSRIIRKQAQRQLQKLTGQVYDIES